MQSRRTVFWALIALLVSTLGLLTGCKNDVPTGRITPKQVTLKVDEIAHIELLMAPKFDGVQREMWKIEPKELGEVYFDQAAPRRRKATVRGKSAGKGKVVVHGFFGGAPKPYRIADVPLTVEQPGE